MNFQDDIPSIPFDKFKDYYVPVFDWTSMQDATEKFHYPKVAGEPLRLELNYISPLDNITELNVSGKEIDKSGVRGKTDNVSLQQKINRIPLLKYRYLGSIPSDYVSTPDKDTFAVINTQPSNVQCEHSIMYANFCHKLYFADYLGRPSFFKQKYKQMLPEPLQTHPSVCGFYRIYAVFHILKFQPEKLLEFTMMMYFHS